MLNINGIHCTGRLLRDPETKNLSGGTVVCNFAIAINNPRQVNGEWKDEPVFIDVEAYSKTAERAADLSKGDPVYIEGKLKMDSWEDKEGNKRTKIKISAMSIKVVERGEKATSGRSDRTHAGNYKQKSGGASENLHFETPAEDEVPW